jgi:hypothetical protein
MPLNDSTKRFTGRMAQLHDTTENWNALRGFIPAAGEIIIYDDWKEEIVDGKKRWKPGVKIGTGNAYVQDLKFCNEADTEAVVQNLVERGYVPSTDDRLRWDGKLSVRDAQEVIDENLILRRE